MGDYFQDSNRNVNSGFNGWMDSDRENTTRQSSGQSAQQTETQRSQNSAFGESFYTAQQASFQNTFNGFDNFGPAQQTTGYAYNPWAAKAKEERENEVINGSFLYMFIALLITAVVSGVALYSPTIFMLLYGNGISFLVLAFAEIGVVIASQAAMQKNQVTASAVLFFVYSVLNGLNLTYIYLLFTVGSIFMTFFGCAVMFGVMALVGLTTKKDLTGLSSLVSAGLIAIILMSLVNVFIGSTALDIGTCIFGVILFLGITAYDVQKIRKIASANSGYENKVLSLWGAMQLYLDFINLFLRLLRLFGKRRS